MKIHFIQAIFVVGQAGPEVIKLFMVNTIEHEISTAHDKKKLKNTGFLHSQMMYLSCLWM